LEDDVMVTQKRTSLGITRVLVVLCCGVAALAVSVAASASDARYQNCKALNIRYPHGVGRVGAHDHTSTGHPVGNFTRNTRVYLANRSLDRDKDGIACEKR
jgi:excalibur calcium-binding domain-containing protein